MSFHYEHHSAGVFLDDDLNIVQTAYTMVLAEAWDTFGPSNVQVARYILRMYDRGISDPEKLRHLACLHFRTRLRLLDFA